MNPFEMTGRAIPAVGVIFLVVGSYLFLKGINRMDNRAIIAVVSGWLVAATGVVGLCMWWLSPHLVLSNQ